MLIGNTILTNTGVHIYDVDGSHQDISAEQALDLETWLQANHDALRECVQQKQAQDKEEMNEQSRR